MIKKIICPLSLASVLAFNANAQHAQPCGTDEVYHRLLIENPKIAERANELELQIQAQLKNMSIEKLSRFAKGTSDDDTVINIPLVFHVIHNYGSEYVSDDSIIKAVEYINEAYNKRNTGELAGVITPYKGKINNSNTDYIANARINFYLPSKDPYGNPTTGITRRKTNLTTQGSDNAKYDQWPPQNYMNIWLINSMSSTHSSAAAYAYKPAIADVIPFYDGIISQAAYLNRDNTLAHELAHEFNIDHVWGGTNQPEVACGDDAVDDTPPTKGHSPSNCSNLAAIYDTACLYTRNLALGKVRIDTILRDSPVLTPAIITSTSTTNGLEFENRTATTIHSLKFYPSAPIGSEYLIAISRGSTIIDSIRVVSTVENAAQTVTKNFNIPASPKSTKYKLHFLENPGVYADTIAAAVTGYNRGVNGAVFITSNATDGYYNYFYDMKFTHGFFKIYDNDSLVDYPDTVNAQNIMDYTYCSKMFTPGQVERMRAALNSTTGKRNELHTPENLERTGFGITPAVTPQAEYSIERGRSAAGTTSSEQMVFSCAENGTADVPFSFEFVNRTWRAIPTSLEWSLSNDATVPTSTSTTNVRTKFKNTGWADVILKATNANGSTEFESNTKVYIADPNAIDAKSVVYEFNNAEENSKFPTFNHFDNRYKWQVTDNAGTYDRSSMKYTSYDNRIGAQLYLGSPAADYDDFYTPAIDLSTLGSTGYMNFMYAGAYAVLDPAAMKDVLEIAYSTNCGGTWNIISTMSGAELQTAGSVVDKEFNPDWMDWKGKSIELKSGTAAIRNERVFFRFRYKPSVRNEHVGLASGNNFFIDRIQFSDWTLSLDNKNIENTDFVLAPNPTNQNTFVTFKSNNSNVTVKVLDITGKLVYEAPVQNVQSGSKIEIPAAQFSAKGIYMIKVVGDNNLNKTEKLIVQ
jgi:hypothetical protein